MSTHEPADDDALASASAVLAMLAPGGRGYHPSAQTRAFLLATQLDDLTEHSRRVNLALDLAADAAPGDDPAWGLSLAGVKDLGALRDAPERIAHLRARLVLLLTIAARECRTTPIALLQDLAGPLSRLGHHARRLVAHLIRERSRALAVASQVHASRPDPSPAPPPLLDYLARVLPDRAPPTTRVVIDNLRRFHVTGSAITRTHKTRPGLTTQGQPAREIDKPNATHRESAAAVPTPHP